VCLVEKKNKVIGEGGGGGGGKYELEAPSNANVGFATSRASRINDQGALARTPKASAQGLASDPASWYVVL